MFCYTVLYSKKSNGFYVVKQCFWKRWHTDVFSKIKGNRPILKSENGKPMAYKAYTYKVKRKCAC